MRGTPPSLGVEVGSSPQVIESGSTRTTVRVGNAILTLHGSIAERRDLITALGVELGLRVELPEPIFLGAMAESSL